MRKHTPGPWRADDNGDGTHCITAGRGADIADTRASGDEKANARLIAAAPNLLASCEKYRAAQQHFQGCHQCGADLRGNVWYCTDYHRLLSDAVQTADAAISKSKGA